MDVDNIENDFDGKFFDQFRSMGTTDRDVLIEEFRAVLGNQINKEQCEFFLDMNNWNLQNAVCSYYDFEQPSSAVPSMVVASAVPSMVVVSDATIGHTTSTPPNSAFVKKWIFKNSGVERWPPGCNIRYCSGERLSSVEWRTVEALSPGEEKEVAVEMVSPSLPGQYVSNWRMSTPTGVYFGESIQISLVVVVDAASCASMEVSAQQTEASCGSVASQTCQEIDMISSHNKMQHELSQTSTSNLDEDTEMS